MKGIARFIEEARAKFGDRYDYSLAEYVNSETPLKIICRTHGVFEQPPSWHLNSAIGCQKCSYNVSSKETTWLDNIHLPATAKRHAKVKLDGRLRSVDAYDPVSGTIWEFLGDWWHGNPKFFPADGVHHKCKKTYGQLYRETLAKRRAIKKAGYTLVEIWEHQFDLLVARGKMPSPRKQVAKSA